MLINEHLTLTAYNIPITKNRNIGPNGLSTPSRLDSYNLPIVVWLGRPKCERAEGTSGGPDEELKHNITHVF